MKRYEDICQVFNLLNAMDVNYLVLRNYEMMLSSDLFVGDHADIDLLCEDSREIVKVLDAHSARKDRCSLFGDGIHYFLSIGGRYVSFDLRQVGDGYYCEQWERDLLKRRKKYECFYVMNDEDYFYTLIYHAILQKQHFSTEYKHRLREMALRQGIIMRSTDESDFIYLLEEYMKKNGYHFVYSSDYMVPNKFHLVDSDMIEKDYFLWFRHFLFDSKVALIDFLVKVKHWLKR